MGDEKVYTHSRKPTGYELAIREVWLTCGRSVPKAAFELGVERRVVIAAVDVCADWAADVYTDRHIEALQVGMSQADARMHAEMEVAYRYREVANGR